MRPMTGVSIVIPTMNEEETISDVISKAKKTLEDLNLPYEIVVVDNSSDKTPEIAESLGAKVIKGVKGYGKAYIEGFKIAKGDYIVMLDADGTYNPEEIPKLLEPLIKNKADVVLGSRFKGKILPKAMPILHRYIGNPLLTWIMNFLFKTNISDSHSGMRAFKKDVLSKIKLVCPGMEFASEMLIEVARKNLRIAEVPITYYPRRGQSKLKSFRDGWRHLRFMLLYSPTYLFIIPSIIMLSLGIAITGYVLLLEPIRYHTQILGGLLIILGIQTFFFGVSIKVHSSEIGLTEPDKIVNFFNKPSIVEEGIAVGLILILIGLGFGYYIFKTWVETNYGMLNFVNLAIIVFDLIVIGVQIIISILFIGSLKVLNERW